MKSPLVKVAFCRCGKNHICMAGAIDKAETEPEVIREYRAFARAGHGINAISIEQYRTMEFEMCSVINADVWKTSRGAEVKTAHCHRCKNLALAQTMPMAEFNDEFKKLAQNGYNIDYSYRRKLFKDSSNMCYCEKIPEFIDEEDGI